MRVCGRVSESERVNEGEVEIAKQYLKQFREFIGLRVQKAYAYSQGLQREQY